MEFVWDLIPGIEISYLGVCLTRVIIVRHGETAWNNASRFQGTLNVKLNDTGVEQAKALAESFKGQKIDAIYSSPLDRAKQTAETIAAYHGHHVALKDEFIEIDHGKWEGLFLKEVVNDDHLLYQEWLNNPQNFLMPKGESLAQVRERVVSAFYRIVENHPDQTVILVGHDATNKVLICELLGVDNSHFWQIKQGNGAITIFDYERGQSRLILLNDTCYLGGGLIDTTAPGAL